MTDFQLTSDFQPTGDQPDAIAQLVEGLNAGERTQTLLGATGTGKTAIAFQVAWKLFQARWNSTGVATRRPRILFLADRNILENQAYKVFH